MNMLSKIAFLEEVHDILEDLGLPEDFVDFFVIANIDKILEDPQSPIKRSYDSGCKPEEAAKLIVNGLKTVANRYGVVPKGFLNSIESEDEKEIDTNRPWSSIPNILSKYISSNRF